MNKIIFGEEQQQALNLIKNFIRSPEKVFTLVGYAGTGKTTLIKELIDYFENEGIRYVLAAPTHKAKSVIRYKTQRDATTIHSLLSLSPEIEIMNLDLRNVNFVSNSLKATYGIPGRGVVICDEASMVNDFLYQLLLEKCGIYKAKIIFIGDIAQLKPVNDDYESLVFTNKNKFELKTIFRQSDSSALAEVLPSLRKSSYAKFTTSIKSDGSIICTPTAKELFEYAVPIFREGVKNKDIFKSKILAYTNKRMQALNYKMRELLFKTNEEYVSGDFLTGYENFSSGFVNFWNSMDYVVIKDPVPIEYEIPHFTKVPAFELTLYDYADDAQEEVIMLSKKIDKNYIHSLSTLIEETRTQAVIRKQNHDRSSSIFWKKYYEIINSFASPFDIYYQNRVVKKKTFDYGYGCTVHKS